MRRQKTKFRRLRVLFLLPGLVLVSVFGWLISCAASTPCKPAKKTAHPSSMDSVGFTIIAPEVVTA